MRLRNVVLAGWLALHQLIVGDQNGELFAHQKGSVGLDTEMRLYSATKWVSAVAIVAHPATLHPGPPPSKGISVRKNRRT